MLKNAGKHWNNRNSRPEVFNKMCALKILSKLTVKHQFKSCDF